MFGFCSGSIGDKLSSHGVAGYLCLFSTLMYILLIKYKDKITKIVIFMDPVRNPFTPGAGAQPTEMAGREQVLQRAIVALQRIQLGRPERSALLIGLRGVGKTVLLNRIKEEADKLGYNTAIIESPEEKTLAELLVPALRQILLRIDLAAASKEHVRKALGALRSFASVFNVTIGILVLELIQPQARLIAAH